MRWPWVSGAAYESAAHTNALLEMENDRLWTQLKVERDRHEKLVERITNAALARNETIAVPSAAAPSTPLPDAILDALDGLNLRGAEYAEHEARARRWLERGMDPQAVRVRLVEGDVPEGL